MTADDSPSSKIKKQTADIHTKNVNKQLNFLAKM